MKPPTLVVLDVGHGNAAVLVDTGGVVVIDAGKGGVILDFLKQVGIDTVDVFLVSHADDDHVGSAPHLLLDCDIKVRRLYFNSDPSKVSRSWAAFRDAIHIARVEKDLEAHAELTTTLTGQLDQGGVRVEVLFPPPEMATSAPGGVGEAGRPITSNSMSAAVRLVMNGVPSVLLAGDVEQTCLDRWREDGIDPRAKILIFPHHGGQPGAAAPAAFTAELCRAVQPHTILFSIHRSKHELPIPEVVREARRTLGDVRIACTQLSQHCARDLPSVRALHLLDLPARGRETATCCAGTVAIELTTDGPVIRPAERDHLEFIHAAAPTPLCGGR